MEATAGVAACGQPPNAALQSGIALLAPQVR